MSARAVRGRALALAAVLLAACSSAVPAAQAPAGGPDLTRLAVAHFEPTGREGWLAQRTITRQWGLSEDSVYREVDVPGYKSEGLAMAMSAVLPGTGQLYVGESGGWLWLLGEAAGVAGFAYMQHRADDEARRAAQLVGSPYDSTAGWSFSRFQQHGGSNVANLQALWAGDREAFYRTIATDPQYVAGFAGDQPTDLAQTFIDVRFTRDDDYSKRDLLERLLWVNHVVSAIEALRAARTHNLPLGQQYHLQLGERLRRGRPELRAAIVRNF